MCYKISNTKLLIKTAEETGTHWDFLSVPNITVLRGGYNKNLDWIFT